MSTIKILPRDMSELQTATRCRRCLPFAVLETLRVEMLEAAGNSTDPDVLAAAANTVLANAAVQFKGIKPALLRQLATMLIQHALTYYTGSSGGEGIVIPGDPLIPSMIINGVEYGNVSYEMAGEVVPGGNKLTWDFPSTFYGSVNVPGTGTGSGTPNWPCNALLLQRSITAIDMPFGEATPFHMTVNQANQPEPPEVYANSDWSTIKTWGPGIVSQMPLEWTDSVTYIAAYRLVMFMGQFVITNPGWAEVDWNVVVCFPPQAAPGINRLSDNGGQTFYNRISWSAPGSIPG